METKDEDVVCSLLEKGNTGDWEGTSWTIQKDALFMEGAPAQAGPFSGLTVRCDRSGPAVKAPDSKPCV